MSKQKAVDIPFPMSEFERRMGKVREGMKKSEINVLLVTDLKNICYLTGCQLHLAMDNALIVWDGEPIQIVRWIEMETASSTSWVKNVVPYFNEWPQKVQFLDKLVETLKGEKLDNKRIGVELGSIDVEAYEMLKKLLPNAVIIDGSGIIGNVKVIKSKLELDYIRKATKINQKVLRATIDSIEVGKTENDLLVYNMQKALEEGDFPLRSSFPYKSIIQVGWHAEYMHRIFYGPDTKRIEKGDVVWMETAAFIKRYPGVGCRTAVVGKPSRKLDEAISTQNKGVAKCIEAMRPGAISEECDAACRNHIVKAGFGDYLSTRFRTGYSLGIDWVDGTLDIQLNEKRTLRPGMIFHVIPLLNIPGLGTIGGSEVVLVTEDGHEVLGSLERGLFVL